MTRIGDWLLPFALALAIHAAAVAMMFVAWDRGAEVTRVIKPRIVNSTLIVLEPKAAPARAAAPAPRVEPTREPAPPDTAQRDRTERERVERERAERERAEREAELAAQRAAEQEKLARLAELANASFEDLLQDEADTLAADDEAQAAQSYRYLISEQVKRNWSRPPSARLGMRVRLLIELVPTGQVVGVTIVESSGSPEFDRSAEQAVRKVRRFEVPKESALFEKHFRKFYFLFEPVDLLR